MDRVEQWLRRFLAVMVLVLAHGLIVIFAGHGIGPIALLMVFGSPTAWLSGQLLAWMGAAVLLPALLVRSEPALVSFRFWGAGLLLLSAAAFISQSDAAIFSALTASPLLGLWLYWLKRYVASSRAGANGARPGRPWPVTVAVVALGITLAYGAVFLAPAFTRASVDWLEVVVLVELLALAGLAGQTWKGAWWGRWGIAVLLVGTRVVYAREMTEVVRRPALEGAVTAALLVLDVVILILLFSRPASAWLRSGTSEPV
jgi:hypothetical protein